MNRREFDRLRIIRFGLEGLVSSGSSIRLRFQIRLNDQAEMCGGRERSLEVIVSRGGSEGDAVQGVRSRHGRIGCWWNVPMRRGYSRRNRAIRCSYVRLEGASNDRGDEQPIAAARRLRGFLGGRRFRPSRSQRERGHTYRESTRLAILVEKASWPSPWLPSTRDLDD